MQKIEAGTYGICEVSGEEIPFERLEAMPTATTCIQHATNKLNMNTRPVEEEVLSPSSINTMRIALLSTMQKMRGKMLPIMERLKHRLI